MELWKRAGCTVDVDERSDLACDGISCLRLPSDLMHLDYITRIPVNANHV